MIGLSHSELIDVLDAERSDITNAEFRGVTIDSRQACDGKLFVAIKGDNFDGHRFVEAAYRNGATIALVEQRQDCDIAQVVVDDCKRAMGNLANFWRWQCKPLVIALTGSNGKTTVKEMLYQVLLRQAPTLATRGNFNNDIGLPLSLFELEPGHEFAVIEMGANHRGEIARLAEIAQPDIVYINNVAPAHLAGFGSIQGVIEAKGEIYAYCQPQHKALFNIDERATDYWMSSCAAETRLSCALDQPADVSLDWRDDAEALHLDVRYAGETQSCTLAMIGEHNARNALAAIALALLAGLDLATACSNLAGFSGVKGRLQMLPGPAQSRIVDDSYNANPGSLAAGIKALCALPGKPWLALGDMAELGDDAAEMHRAAAADAREQGVEQMFAFGDLSCRASVEFGTAGHCFDDIEAMAMAIRNRMTPDVNLLVKGSRAAGMERLVQLLSKPTAENANAV